MAELSFMYVFMISYMLCLVFFFFQAEDGIRDLIVTGVQTCALPISILEYNAKALVGLLAWKLSLEQAIELPNLIARGDTFSGEIAKFSPALLAGLREIGRASCRERV